MEYATFLRRQWQALLDEWLGLTDPSAINTAFIALPSLDWVDRLSRPEQPGGGGHWSPLPNVAPTEALVRRRRDGAPQLWVRPEEKAGGSGRYAAFWNAFVVSQGLPAPPSSVNGRALAVDHLFPETAAARRGWLLVRAMPVDRRSNSLVGSAIERVEAQREGATRPRTATSITLAKVTGFQGSFARANDSGAVAAALLAHIRSCGLHVPPGTLLDTVEADLVQGLIEFCRR